MKRLVLAALMAAIPTTAFAAGDASLTVKIEHVSDKGGNIRLGVYDKDKFSVRGVKPDAGKVVPAVAGETVLTVDGIAPGDYGIKVFQDENRNGKIDTSFIGMPTEPFGFSNDAKLNMGPPAFDAAKITLKPGPNTLTITLQ